MEEREPLPVTIIEKEVNVVVEFAVCTWKWEQGSNMGDRLDLLSIGLVQEANVDIDFASRKKERYPRHTSESAGGFDFKRM
jgi:hypothetical protein